MRHIVVVLLQMRSWSLVEQHLWISVNEGHSLHVVLLVVVILVPSQNEVLLCFLQAHWPYCSRSFTCDVYVSHALL